MATYYVDGAVGSDSNAGTSEGAGNAWATINYADNNSSAGDQIWIKSSADYTEAVSLAAGTVNSWKVFSGYASTTGDGGKATIDATGETHGITSPSFGNSYIRVENIIVENASSDGWYINATSYFVAYNCESNNSGLHGFSGGSSYDAYIYCSATGNVGDGLGVGTTSVAAYCVSIGNGGDGFTGSGYAAIGCESISNATDAFSGTPLCVIGSTIDGDGKDTNIGIVFGAYGSIAANNIIYDCDTGISGTSGRRSGTAISNLLYSNTTNFSNVTDEHDNITGSAPAFTDEAGGDYTLAAGSAARNAGADASGTSSPGMDIGAHQSADAGGRVIITG